MTRESQRDSVSTVLDAADFKPDAGEIMLGKLDSIDAAGNPVISIPQLAAFAPQSALATVPVLPAHIGRQLAVMFTQSPKPQPVIIGFIYSPLSQILDSVLAASAATDGHPDDELVFETPVTTAPLALQNSGTVRVDGKQIIFEGEEEILLRCGEASITLSRNGKISIRGNYLLSRATGTNRILGGSVQVN